jgi:hypothetical protein
MMEQLASPRGGRGRAATSPRAELRHYDEAPASNSRPALLTLKTGQTVTSAP